MSTAEVDPTFYCQIVGKLIFLTITRPDLAFAVSIVSRYMAQPQQAHLELVRHILRYVKKTSNYGILYRKNGNKLAAGYTDAD
jgi:hypothetical protein